MVARLMLFVAESAPAEVRYEQAMLSYLRSDHADVLGKIRDTKALDDDTAGKLKDALAAFGKQFA